MSIPTLENFKEKLVKFKDSEQNYKQKYKETLINNNKYYCDELKKIIIKKLNNTAIKKNHTNILKLSNNEFSDDYNIIKANIKNNNKILYYFIIFFPELLIYHKFNNITDREIILEYIVNNIIKDNDPKYELKVTRNLEIIKLCLIL